MSYRSDMEFYNSQIKKRKSAMARLLKASIIVLACVILVTGAAVGIAWATGGFSEAAEESGNKDSADRKKPVITGPEGDKAIAYIGESIAYKSFVKASDNSGEVNLSVDASAVNVNAEGSYSVTYTATDAAGNKAEYVLTLIIKKKEYSLDTLMRLVAQKADALGITKDMSRVEQVRRIYEFVNGPSGSGKFDANIYFNDESNTPSQQLSRENWQIDWIEEACRTLTMSRMEGDCYTYYSVSKAFFEYFEIPNIGIQRSPNARESGTHFWCVVNVGTSGESLWYYYDATRLMAEFPSGGKNACLITEEKLNSYVTSSGGTEFYKFDKPSDFPVIATKELS